MDNATRCDTELYIANTLGTAIGTLCAAMLIQTPYLSDNYRL